MKLSNELTEKLAGGVCNYLKKMDEVKIMEAVKEMGEAALRKLMDAAKEMEAFDLCLALQKAIFKVQLAG